MSPPHYADLGKKANDVFSKGYHFGVFKLDLKTRSESGVEFTSGITSNQESGKVRIGKVTLLAYNLYSQSKKLHITFTDVLIVAIINIFVNFRYSVAFHQSMQ